MHINTMICFFFISIILNLNEVSGLWGHSNVNKRIGMGFDPLRWYYVKDNVYFLGGIIKLCIDKMRVKMSFPSLLKKEKKTFTSQLNIYPKNKEMYL